MTAFYWDFTQACGTCGETVEYVAGVRQPHPCPEGPALTIEGCSSSVSLADRVAQALDDYEQLNAGRQ